MGLITRIGMLVKSNINAIVTAAKDPEKILEQSIIDMQEDLVQLRQAAAQPIAALKLQEEQYRESATQAQESENRAILAIQKGEENLAREALSRKKTHADLAATLKAGLDEQSRQVETLKKNLIAIESKIYKAKCAAGMLICVEHGFKERSFELDFSADDPDTEFARLEDDGSAAELAAIRAKMITSSPEPEGALAPSDEPSVGASIDAEIEALRRQMG